MIMIFQVLLTFVEVQSRFVFIQQGFVGWP